MTRGRELVLGGQKSGKSRYAEQCALEFLHRDEQNQLVFLVTAQAGDAEMTARIIRHRQDRARQFPNSVTVEVAANLSQVIRQYRDTHTLLVIDCLTLWLTGLLMPLGQSELGADASEKAEEEIMDLLRALQESAQCPIVIVSNEIGLGVIPLGAQTRHFVDRLGVLNQQVAAHVDHVTLMVAGLPLILKKRPL